MEAALTESPARAASTQSVSFRARNERIFSFKCSDESVCITNDPASPSAKRRWPADSCIAVERPSAIPRPSISRICLEGFFPTPPTQPLHRGFLVRHRLRLLQPPNPYDGPLSTASFQAPKFLSHSFFYFDLNPRRVAPRQTPRFSRRGIYRPSQSLTYEGNIRSE